MMRRCRTYWLRPRRPSPAPAQPLNIDFQRRQRIFPRPLSTGAPATVLRLPGGQYHQRNLPGPEGGKATAQVGGRKVPAVPAAGCRPGGRAGAHSGAGTCPTFGLSKSCLPRNCSLQLRAHKSSDTAKLQDRARLKKRDSYREKVTHS